MDFAKPSFEIMEVMAPGFSLELIEKAGRTCYKSEEKITEGSAKQFNQKLIDLGHEAMIEHSAMTVRFICDRGVTHEIVRHRLVSYAQESTRYCNYSKLGIRFIIPSDFNLEDDDIELLRHIESHYNKCLNEKYRTPQQARYFLPNGLKTEIVMTANFREWKHFFKMRCAKSAHPDMRALVIPLHKKCKEIIPIIFDSILY